MSVSSSASVGGSASTGASGSTEGDGLTKDERRRLKKQRLRARKIAAGATRMTADQTKAKARSKLNQTKTDEAGKRQ